MIHTEIELTEDQMRTLEEVAKRRHISLAALIQEGIGKLLHAGAISRDDELKQRALSVAGRFRSGLGDLSRRHDDYLAEAK